MKIFLSGAQGVGKSSIVNNFPIERYNIIRYDSMSKKFMKTPETQNPNNKEYMEFQHKIALYCYNLYINNNNFICSRGLADSEAYILYSWFKNFNLRGELDLLMKMIDIYTNILKNEDKIYYFYIPIEFEISRNGNNLRQIDKDFQRDIDYKIVSYLKRNKIKYTTLTGNIENRIKKIEDIINENKS